MHTDGAAHQAVARLSVGRMAEAAGVTAQALRHYDRIGLFRPDGVDDGNGYRWYAADRVPQARLIARLRRVGVPLDDVRAVLAAPVDAGVLDRTLQRHCTRLESRLTRVRGDLHRLTHLTTELPEGIGMTSAPDLPDQVPTSPSARQADERRLAVDLFNGVWALLETEDRTPDDDDRMLHMAHASRHHWGRVGTPANLARGEWLCSRVYAVLGRSEPCLHHAERVLDLCQRHGLADWDLAFAHEALARAHALAGRTAEAKEATDRARAVVIADDEDRELLEADLGTIPA